MSRLCQMLGLTLTSLAATMVASSAMTPAADATLAPISPAPILSVDHLLRLDRASLEQIYRQSGVGALPIGAYAGRATPEPGTRAGLRQEKRIGLIWKGKEFPNTGMMINRLALGVHAIQAEMLIGESFLDGQPTIVLDYAHTSKLARDVRDEMREVSPGTYLGLTYVRKCPTPKLTDFYCLQPLPDDMSTHLRHR